MLDIRLFKGVPVGQVVGQPVDVADDDHVDLADLDRRDQLPEPVTGDYLDAEYPSSLKVVTTVQPRRAARSVPGPARSVPTPRRRSRLDGHTRPPELGFRSVCLRVVHYSITMQNPRGRILSHIRSELASLHLKGQTLGGCVRTHPRTVQHQSAATAPAEINLQMISYDLLTCAMT